MSQATEIENNYSNVHFFNLVQNRIKFKFFLFSKIPSAYFSGVHIEDLSEQSATTSIKLKWFNQNPFHSMYFACLAMTAEMSTGLLAMSCIYKRKPSVSMLVTQIEASFYKKATGIIKFNCMNGLEIKKTIDNAIHLGISQSIKVNSIGYNTNNEKVAEFWFTWSFKMRAEKGN